MKKLLAIYFLLFAYAQSMYGQQVQGGQFEFKHTECLNEQQREKIFIDLEQSRQALIAQGLLQPTNPNAKMITLFDWPLKQAAGINDPGYYSISNYVDQDNTANILDYNCGNITYNGHHGTDIFTWPFWWYKMDNNQVEIISAAAGTILYKSNGNFDRSCASNNNNWNAVYVQHSDGSVAWYGHMKNNSLTAKAIGQTVVAGEYLGVLGSSGNSTGPHLHFEVYNPSNVLVDPFSGACNSLNVFTWWNNQLPYKQSGLNKIMTHSTPPVFPACPTTETPNAKNEFCAGNTVYFSAYYRNQQNGQVLTHKIYRPDNSIFQQWTQTFTTFYQASWWYYSWTLPGNAPSGNWRYEIAYNGSTYNHTFTVGPPVVVVTPPGPVTLCAGSSVTIISSAGTGNIWSNGATTQSITVNTAGTYTVSVSNICGTATSAPVVVNTVALPTATISTNTPTTFCSGGSVTLNANTGVGLTYVWKKNGVVIANATASTYVANKTGNYRVVVTNANGCSKTSAAKVVTVNGLPTATVTPAGPIAFCVGDSAVLTANQGTGLTYQWKKFSNNINGAASLSYVAKTASTYKVVVTNANGCARTSNAVVVSVNCRLFAATDNNAIQYDAQSNSIIVIAEVDEVSDGTLTIWSMDGRKISELTAMPNEMTKLKPELNSGVYFVQFQNDETTISSKIIVQ